MTTAIASNPVAALLALLTLTAIASEAQSQGRTERAPDAITPNLKRRPEPLPASPGAEREAPAGEEEEPSANDEAPPSGRGCPDHGRTLELIV
jgi:hypothetical protein